MKKIFENLQYLKLGTNTSNYPVYAQLLFSKDGDLITCNNSEYVCLHGVDFDLNGGAINLYVLENLLKLFDGDVGEYEIKDDKVIINRGSFKTELNISRMELPHLDFGDVDTFKITEELLTALKKALPFTGSGILEYVYLCQDFICATNGSRLMVIDTPEYGGEPVGISRKILSILKVGDSIGTKDHNVIVYFEGGHIVFTVDKVDTYPAEKIKKFIDKSFDNTEELFDLDSLRVAFSQVEPVLFKETKKLVTMTNGTESMMSIRASSINGDAKASIDSVSSKKFELVFDIDYIKGITDKYDVLVGKEVDKLLLCSIDTRIGLMGYN